jgi:hypothetical protein
MFRTALVEPMCWVAQRPWRARCPPGRSLDPQTDVNSRNHREWPHGRACAPVRGPAEPGRRTALPPADAGGRLMCGLEEVAWPVGLLGHTDWALTCEGDVAVTPLGPEGDVGDAGVISEGDVEGDVSSDNREAKPAPIRSCQDRRSFQTNWTAGLRWTGKRPEGSR